MQCSIILDSEDSEEESYENKGFGMKAIQTYNKALVAAPGNQIILMNLEKAQSKSTNLASDEIISPVEPRVIEQEPNLVKSNNQESSNIFEQIGNMFSSLFGFLS